MGTLSGPLSRLWTKWNGCAVKLSRGGNSRNVWVKPPQSCKWQAGKMLHRIWEGQALPASKWFQKFIKNPHLWKTGDDLQQALATGDSEFGEMARMEVTLLSSLRFERMYPTCWELRLLIASQGSPGGSVVENPPANTGDASLIPSPGRSHSHGATRSVCPSYCSSCTPEPEHRRSRVASTPAARERPGAAARPSTAENNKQIL